MQIVGFESGLDVLEYDLIDGTNNEPDVPHLILEKNGELDRIYLEQGEFVDYKLGERRCAGSITNGVH